MNTHRHTATADERDIGTVTIEVPIESRAMQITRWCLAALFLFTGVTKLMGLPTMQQTFDDFGYSYQFMLVIGVLETAGAIGLMVPQLILWAALGLCSIMVGAILTHLMHDPLYMALPALIVLLLLGRIAWLRWQAFRGRPLVVR